ncbi:MAG TPA: DUF2381 family protein [Myxococcaceae bacterium]
MLASPRLAFALSLLASAPAAAELPPLPGCQAIQERIDLLAEPEEKRHTLCISPGIVTTWLFDASLPPGAIGLDVEAQQEVVLLQAGRLVTLLPSEKLMPGRRLNMMVRFDDGAAPTSIAFELVVHPARAHRQVEVFRRRRTVESYQQALRVKEAEVQQCHEENAQLRATQGRLDGLRGLRSAELMSDLGVAATVLTRSVTSRPGSKVEVLRAVSFRSVERVAVEVELDLTALAGGKAWNAEGAALVGPSGRELPVLGVWQEPREARSQVVMVEAKAAPGEAQGTFTLKLWEHGGARSVTLQGVTFPQLPP